MVKSESLIHHFIFFFCRIMVLDDGEIRVWYTTQYHHFIFFFCRIMVLDEGEIRVSYTRQYHHFILFL